MIVSGSARKSANRLRKTGGRRSAVELLLFSGENRSRIPRNPISRLRGRLGAGEQSARPTKN